MLILFRRPAAPNLAVDFKEIGTSRRALFLQFFFADDARVVHQLPRNIFFDIAEKYSKQFFIIFVFLFVAIVLDLFCVDFIVNKSL